MALSLTEIIPWGRCRREYELMFNLHPQDLAGGVLDCGGGPASFSAEMAALGNRVVSVDPIYAFSGAQIRARFDAVSETVISQIRATPQDWTWTYHRDPDDLLVNRRTTIEAFLTDYKQGIREQRYVIGELPRLPFAARSFGLAVCSHLLFLYSELLSEEFHLRSLLELCRVAEEVRVFPLLTLARNRSPHLVAVQGALNDAGFRSEVVRVGYELQRGGNQMLRIFRNSHPSSASPTGAFRGKKPLYPLRKKSVKNFKKLLHTFQSDIFSFSRSL
jgi:hypothetical protein